MESSMPDFPVLPYFLGFAQVHVHWISPWDSPGKNTAVHCHFLLQGIFPTQGSNPSLPHCRQTPDRDWATRLYLIESVMLFKCFILCHPSFVFSLSQHQGLFQWFDSSHHMTTVLEFQLQHQSFQWIFQVVLILDLLVWYPCCPRDYQVFSSTTDQKHQFFSAQPSLWSDSHICAWLLEKP